MPTDPIATILPQPLQPYYYPERSRTRAVNLAPGTYVAGQALGVYSSASGTNEVQTLTASGTVSGGTYKLSFNGYQTAAIAYNATNATIKAALEALIGIEVGDVVIGGGAFPGTPVTITFAGQYAKANVPLLAVDTSLLTGTTPGAAVTETTPGASANPTYGKYDDAASDGRQTLVAFLKWPAVVNPDGTLQMAVTPGYGQQWGGRTAAVYDQGYFHTADLVGLDANGLADLQGQVKEGTLASGVIYVP